MIGNRLFLYVTRDLQWDCMKVSNYAWLLYTNIHQVLNWQSRVHIERTSEGKRGRKRERKRERRKVVLDCMRVQCICVCNRIKTKARMCFFMTEYLYTYALYWIVMFDYALNICVCYMLLVILILAILLCFQVMDLLTLRRIKQQRLLYRHSKLRASRHRWQRYRWKLLELF